MFTDCMPCLIPNRPSTHTVYAQCLLTARLFVRFVRAVGIVVAHPREGNTFAPRGTTRELFWAAHLLLCKQRHNTIQSYTHHEQFLTAGLHCSFWMIALDASLKVDSVYSPFIKSDHPRWRMKAAGRSQLSFTLDESSKVTNVNVSLHVPP
jgi:hypothetical protein